MAYKVFRGGVSWLTAWACRNVKISVEHLKRYIDDLDTNKDGYIDLGEMLRLVRRERKEN